LQKLTIIVYFHYKLFKLDSNKSNICLFGLKFITTLERYVLRQFNEFNYKPHCVI